MSSPLLVPTIANGGTHKCPISCAPERVRVPFAVRRWCYRRAISISSVTCAVLDAPRIECRLAGEGDVNMRQYLGWLEDLRALNSYDPLQSPGRALYFRRIDGAHRLLSIKSIHSILLSFLRRIPALCAVHKHREPFWVPSGARGDTDALRCALSKHAPYRMRAKVSPLRATGIIYKQRKFCPPRNVPGTVVAKIAPGEMRWSRWWLTVLLWWLKRPTLHAFFDS